MIIKLQSSTYFLLFEQELKKAILEDLVYLGKASGLHSFEQVDTQLYLALRSNLLK